MKKLTVTSLNESLPRTPVLLAWLALIAVLIFSYGSSFLLLVGIWWNSPDYGHAFFVPVFSIVLLYSRRDILDSWPTRGSWWGLALIAFAAMIRWVSAVAYFQTLEPLALIPFIAGLTLLVGGWRAMRWAWPAIIFLVFMIPLPGALRGLSATTLQAIGTKATLFVVQTVGIPAVAEGNTIQLRTGPITVADACSGLRMLMLFFAVCVGAAMILRRPLWERAVMIFSAVPIAIVANVARLTATAILYNIGMSDVVEERIHDGVGFLMMPLGIVLLWAEMSLLWKLLLAPISDRPISLGPAFAGGIPPREPDTGQIKHE